MTNNNNDDDDDDDDNNNNCVYSAEPERNIQLAPLKY